MREGNIPLAKKVLDHLERVMPNKVIPYDQFSASMVGLYLSMGEQAKALKMAKIMVDRNDQALDYYLAGGLRAHERDIQIALYEMNVIVSSFKESKVAPAQYKSLESKFTKQLARVQ